MRADLGGRAAIVGCAVVAIDKGMPRDAGGDRGAGRHYPNF
jgi:hypothetical protein